GALNLANSTSRISTDRPPAASVSREQFVCLFRTLASGAIFRQLPISSVAKRVKERLHHAPARLDAVGARIKNGVAGHAVINESFIAGAWGGFEIIVIAECHAHAAERDRRSRNLGIEFETDAFIGLNTDHQEILGETVDRRIAEH